MLLKYTIPLFDKFPRGQKFLLADRMELILIELLGIYTEAYYGSKEVKVTMLNNANRKLHVLRLLIRLSFEMHYISGKQYEFVSKHIFEIGNNTGAWLKSLDGKK